MLGAFAGGVVLEGVPMWSLVVLEKVPVKLLCVTLFVDFDAGTLAKLGPNPLVVEQLFGAPQQNCI